MPPCNFALALFSTRHSVPLPRHRYQPHCCPVSPRQIIHIPLPIEPVLSPRSRSLFTSALAFYFIWPLSSCIVEPAVSHLILVVALSSISHLPAVLAPRRPATVRTPCLPHHRPISPYVMPTLCLPPCRPAIPAGCPSCHFTTLPPVHLPTTSLLTCLTPG